MRNFGLRLAQLLGTGLILGFFSEFFFLNEGPVFDLLKAWDVNPLAALTGLLELGGFYALFAAGFLIALEKFGVTSLAGLLLAGGIYGLAAEGLAVPMIYEAMPVSLVWTSLSWHTLVDVVFGWYLLRRWLRLPGALPGALGLIAGGVFWGGWATWFWVEDPGGALTLGGFATMAIVTSTALLVGNILADLRPVTALRFSWAETAVAGTVSAALFALTGFAYLPLPAFALALLGLIVWALWGAGTEPEDGAGGILAPLEKRPVPWRYLLIALLPASAIATYALVLETGFSVPTEDSVLAITFVGGVSFVWALLWSLRRALRGPG